MQKLLQMPARIDGIIGQIEHGELEVHDTQLAERVRQLKQAVQSVAAAIFFAAFLSAGTQLLLGGQKEAAFGLWGAGAVIIFFLLIRRSK